MTQHFIVIGNPIAHSKSPDIHQNFAQQVGLDIRYARQYCPDDKDSFTAVVEAFFAGGGVGANVTVPFKQMAFELCAGRGGLSNHAQVAGAVNTLLLKDGQIFGDNTDGQGLVNHIMQLGWQLEGANIAIIGAGGATRGVILPLIEAGVRQISIANRTLNKAETLVQELQHASPQIAQAKISVSTIEQLTGQFDMIINATSIGLSGDMLPLSDTLTCNHAYDMMYGRELPFLQHFTKQGATISDGYGMLIGQAKLSFERWTGKIVKNTLI
ncbi:shikimate dehydrogenase [Psychrobacter sp. I-STPA6b]|uniref:shikimate dehydrogenase n=1 Tax=Psychrobacter sp. I-STPA6b TaxID=2585718 RepID=UPI001D0C2AF7|nr:shikimate dehydrogenase [Psychrobacter sp. I-STPA6b]